MEKTTNAKNRVGIIAFALVALISAITLIVGLGTKAFKSKTIEQPELNSKGQTPLHNKVITRNGDGTYTISLDVTGDAETTVTTPRANVIVILDTSSSMNNHRTEPQQNNTGRYGMIDGELVPLYTLSNGNYNRITNDNTGGAVYNKTGETYARYNGTRYAPTAGPRRSDAAEKVVYDFTNSLFQYQSNDDPTNIQMALITFNSSASNRTTGWTTPSSGWTSNASDITRHLSSTGNYNSTELPDNYYGTGTNYEAAFRQALTVLGTADADNTFVIFVTDGEPSQYVGSSGWPGAAVCFGPSQDEARRIQMYDTATHTDPTSANYSNKSNTTLFGIYAYGDESDYLDDVIYYALNGTKRSSETADTDVTGVTGSYYRAADTAQLNSAVGEIFNKIIETLGVTEVSIEDGTTDQVTTSTGEMSHLLEVDTTTFKYWLSFPVVDGKFTRVDPLTGDTIEYNAVDNGNGTVTITWEGHSITVNGSINVGTLKYQWTGSNDLYAKTPPAATYTNSKVDWDLSSVGTLLNGVTYTVTFEVYPSQETNDIIADLKNGLIDYVLPGQIDPRPTVENLDSNIINYIEKVGDNDYSLKTNTGATLTWKDTREDAPYPQHSQAYTPPEPVQTEPDQINMLKRWENDYDAKQVGEIEIGINKDDERYTKVKLESDNEWSAGPINIASGLMRIHYGADGKISSTEILTPGHDFTFEELGEDSYNWEMIAQTIHPMSINHRVRELILVNDQVQNVYTVGDTEQTNPLAVPPLPSTMENNKNLMFYEDGNNQFFRLEEGSDKVYYLVPLVGTEGQEEGVEGSTANNQIPTIKAYNYRRSNLNIQKLVDGDSANPDDLFEFTIDVTDAGLTEDEELWFSVYKGGYIDLTPEDEESRITGTAWVEKKDIIYKENVQGVQDPALGIDHIEYYYHAPKGTTLVVKLKAGENLRFTNLTTQADFTVVESGKPSNYVYQPATEDSFDAWYGKDKTLHHITETDYRKWHKIYDTEDPTKEIGIGGSITVTNSAFYVYINNTYELVNVDVEKEWDDNDNQDGIRPKSVEINLLADGEQVYTESTECEAEEGATAPATCQVPVKVVLNSDNQWKYTFKDLDRYNNGKEIEYTVEETAIPVPEGHATGYTTTYKDLRETEEVVDPETEATSTNITTVGKFIYKVVNTHVPEVTETSVKKEWEDNNNQDGIRPESVTVHLLADGTQATVTSTDCPIAEGETEAPETCQVEATVELSDDNNWTHTYSNLPKYSEGKEIEYTWSEDNITIPSSGFTNGYTATQEVDEDTGLVTITNTHIPEVKPTTVTKVWDDDDNRDNVRPTSIVMTLYDDLDQKVTFKDANGNNTSTVTLTEDIDWTRTVEGLPKYRYDSTNGRVEIQYHWTETVPTNYTKTSDSSSNSVTRIVNTHTVQKTTATVIKVWDDDDDRDKLRPSSITVNLLADGEQAYKITNNGETKTPVSAITLDSSNNWTATVEDLPLNENGEAIEYTWSESSLPKGYTLTPSTDNTGLITTLTNSYTPEKTEVSVEKIWNDNNNQDGIRPTSVTVNLKANGQTAKVYSNNCSVAEGETEAPAICLVNVEPITLNSSNSWKATVENLPLNENGTAISYTWTEDDIEVPEGHATGYTATQATNTETKLTSITNTHTPETVEAQVEKVWDDEDNRDGVRPTSLTVTLNNNKNVTLTTNTVTLNSNNSWKDSISNLPKYSNGEVITYTWDEGTLPDGYTLTTSTDATGLITTLTNTYVPEKTTATVIKVWDDEENRDGIQPESVTVYLKANGNTAKAYSNNCPVADGETEAPASCLVNVDAITLSASNNWTATVENLPLKENGQAIEYTWTEDPVPTNYKVTSSVDETGLITTLTNTHTPEETEVSVKKVWSDNNNQDGIRPTSVTVNLKANGKAAKAYSTECPVAEGETEAPASCLVNVDAITLSASNNWTATVSNLPLKENGTAISYTWTEDDIEVPAGHATGYTATQETNAETKVTTITNTHTPEKTTATVKKIWDDADNQDGIRPTSLTATLSNGSTATLNAANGWEATISDLPKYANGVEIEYTWTEGTLPTGYELTNTAKNGTITSLTNSHTPATITAEVVKVWEDAGNQDGKRPASLTVTLSNNKNVTVANNTVTLNEDNDWSGSITGLPKFANGQEVKYTWTEGTLPTGYALTSSETETTTNGFITTLENTYNPQEISIKVKKVWNDADNQDGLRGNVTFVLTGTESITSYSKTYTKTLTLEEQATSLEYIWQGLPVYNQGKEITYTLDETAYPEGYGKVVAKGATDYEFVVTNSHTPATTEATVKKVWDDAGDQDGKRPETLSVTLSDGQSVTLSDANDWTATLTGLPKFADGVEIEYTWAEDESGLPEGYTLTGNTKEGTITTLTNSRPTEETEATVKKVWEDDENRDGKRPETLTVTLSNGDSVTLSDSNNWTATITGLPRYADGEEIEYTWTEETLPEGYTMTSNTTSGTITTIKNNYIPERVEVTATKKWEDNNNQDGIRPESVLITLLADGKATVSKEANADNKWTVTFENLNKYASGKEIVYSVEETVPTGYKESYSGTVKDGFVITNTHTPAKIDIEVEKQWEDEDNHDGKRPTIITVNLLADGTKVDSKTMTAENNWEKVTFTGLPEKAAGKTINYTVTEEAVTDYQGVVTTTTVNKSYKIVNTHPVEYRKIEGIKVWNDSSNRDNLRPETVTIRLYADGKEVNHTTTDASKEWEYEFDNLPKYENVDNKPHEIEYTVDEDPVPGYKKGIDGYTITNTHEPLVTKVSGTKTWTDADDIEGFRPESITVNLLADGKKIDSAVVSAETEWKFEFTNLPQYKEGEVGKEIAYTISEEDVTGYSVSLTRSGSNPEITIDIENIHEPEYTTISGVKTWKDDDDIEGFRPESITINLLADGTKIDSKTVTAADEWKWSFENLPAHQKGKEVAYSITEETIDGYTSEVTGYDVINTHKPEYISYTINKLWKDDSDRDGLRPKSITVNLLADGVVIDSKTVTEKEEWSCKFENLTKYKKGKAVTYSITEDVVENYTSSITDITDTTTSVTITNTHDPARTEISGKKIWEEDQNYLDRRPDMVTVNIYADGVYLDTIKVKKEDNWEYLVSNLYKYSKGVEIKYTIEEEPVEGYVTVYDGYDITNTFVEGEGCVGPDCNPPKTMVDVEANRYQDYNTIVFLIAGFGALIQRKKISGN